MAIKNLDVVQAVVVLVLGILLLIGALDLETILGIGLIVWASLNLAGKL